nr:uncharacterized protein LOC117276023 [Nicotiana tomentosiformis]
MTYDRNLFKEFTSMGNKKFRIGNDDYILAKEKGTVAIATKSKEKEWSQKNLQSIDNSPTENICENEARKKLSIFQKNKIWKKVDKPQGKIQIWKKVDKSQGKMQMKPKKEPTYFIDNHEMQQNRKVNSIYYKSKD